MNLTRNSFILLVFTCIFLILPAAVHSASVKERMAARIPAIDALKDQGVIGENNAGFLEYRTAEKPQQELIAAENADRDLVYKAIGDSQKAPANLVGQRRAKMIVEKGSPGHWFQRPDGEWYKK